MREMMILGSMVLSLLMLAPYGFADEGEEHGTQATHMKVSGRRLEGAIRPHHREDLLGVDDDRFYRHTQKP